MTYEEARAKLMERVGKPCATKGCRNLMKEAAPGTAMDFNGKKYAFIICTTCGHFESQHYEEQVN